MKSFGSLVILSVGLFLAAGHWDWPAGWRFVGLMALIQVLTGLVLLPDSGELLAERSQMQAGTKAWDRILAPLMAIGGPLAIWITAGLGERFGWSAPLPYGWQFLGLVLALAGSAFTLWAMHTNRFFAATVRIQTERGHRLVDGGPYRIVRHPGYLGALVYNLATPLALDAPWAFAAVALAVVVMVVRTRLEDQTLRKELPGYKRYSARVKWRLIPGVW
jgi:protein-S-isoprenylcysteine O-methyltransferase Ste14